MKLAVKGIQAYPSSSAAANRDMHRTEWLGLSSKVALQGTGIALEATVHCDDRRQKALSVVEMMGRMGRMKLAGGKACVITFPFAPHCIRVPSPQRVMFMAPVVVVVG